MRTDGSPSRLDRGLRAAWRQLRVTRRAPDGRAVTERGVALIASLAIIAIMYGAMVNFSFTTNIDYEQAANTRDDLIARYYARSAMNLGRVVLKVQKDVLDKYRKELGDIQLADYLPMFIGAFGGGKEEVAAFVESVGGMASSELKGLGVPIGEFDLTIDTGEDAKMNLNCGGGSATTQESLGLLLGGMVASRDFDRVFDELDGDGQLTDRSMFVRAIIDWADRDNAAFGQNGATEDYGYETREPPYKARDNYYDSVDEVQLVRGMDERRWAMFAPAFTIYGDCRVNLGALKDPSVLRAIIVASAKDANDAALLDDVNLAKLVMRVLQARMLGMQFDDLKAFAEYIAEPVDPLADPEKEKPKTGDIKGIELEQTKLAQVARMGARRIYRVTATAIVRKVTKKVIAVWDSETTNQNARDASEGRGTWVYWREE